MQPLPSRRARYLAVLFVLIGPLLIAAEPGPALVSTDDAAFLNPDFEAGDPGATPPGWFVPKILADQGFSAVVSTNQPQHGQQCVEIRWPTDRQPSPGLFANLMQRLEAIPWRGKRVKVTASIRVSGTNPAARAQMWLRVDRAAGMGAFDNMNDRPVHSDAWADYSITVDVADDARSLNLGLMALDGATAWWDHVRFEVLTGFTTVTEPSRPLTNPGLSNLVAFARLLGYVRHFHPSDQAATNDWLPFVVVALTQVETAEAPQALAATLEAIFRPVAPTVRVFQEGAGVQMPAELSPVPGDPSLKVRLWEHVGYRPDGQAGAATIYSSQRLSLDARELAPLPAYAQPTNVFRSRLGAGVECLVPTALFANDRGTLPHADRVAAKPGTETRFSVDHRGARLATAMIAWNILRHFYPYGDVIDTDWANELQGALRQAATDTTEAAFYGTLNRLIVALQDGHGTLSGPGMPQEAPLPVKVELIANQVVVVAVGAGITELHPGDIVERIDGVGALEAFQQLAGSVSAATPQRRKQVAFRFGAGPPGNQAKLEVRGADGGVRTVTIARSASLSPLDLKRPPKLHEIRPGVFYVDATRLADQEFNEALPRLALAKGLVFDLRGYPAGSPQWLSHLSRERLQSAHWNVPRQHRPDWTDVEWVTSRWDLTPQEPLLTTNRVFLTDGSAISYAESLLGIIEAYRLGEIVGEATAGTNGNICIVDLPLGYRMVFTGMQVLKHDGSRHHGIGIRPTVPVTRTIEGVREGRDEQLERAVSLVQ